MERSLNDEQKPGEAYVCPNCQCADFLQECMTRGKEKVHLFQKNGVVHTVSVGMEEIAADDIEYVNEFTCTKCGYTAAVFKQNGVETLI